jgi:4-alpha-glucanotransferase
LLQAIERDLNGLPFIAEDLGLITPDVSALRDRFELPGMRVLQFAFNGDPHNPHLPSNYVSDAVVYTGTHDNPTTRQWFEELPDQQRQVLRGYIRQGGESREVAQELMGLAWSSIAALSIAPLQDLLNLGKEARMNVPGRADGNWAWRCSNGMLSDPAFEWLRDLTKNSNRFTSREKAQSVLQPDTNFLSDRKAGTASVGTGN